MRQVFIDKFVVPKDAVDEFTQRMNQNRSFIRSLPGFVQDSAYKRTDEHGNTIVITIAIWQSEESIKRAKDAVQTEYRRINFHPEEMFTRLKITMERGTFAEIDRAG